MFPGVDAEQRCFGPAEIHVMRRALELAEGALGTRRPLPRRVAQEHRQQLARSIIRLAATTGEFDPVVLSAAALVHAPSPAAAPAGAHRPRRLKIRRS